jgi:hypothetical protein
LGRSCKPNSSNNVRRPEDKDRSFGLPTVRSDIPYKAFKSVADWRNFGDEPEACDLLYPSTNLEHGITELDFQQLRSREQIRNLFEKVGCTFKQGKFNTLYNRAAELCDSQDGQISVRAFLQSQKMMQHVE